MTKTTLMVRVEEETKARIGRAAQRKGQSMTTFVLDAVQKAAAQVETRPPQATGTFQGVPSYFRVRIAEAQHGGMMGYRSAGWHFGLHLASHLEEELQGAARGKALDELQRAVDAEDDEGVLAWLVRHFPRCMALVPSRRRGQFLQGIYAVNAERGPIKRF